MQLSLSSRTRLINNIQAYLPKYFSRVHKTRVRMFRAIYVELTGDQSVSSCVQSKEVDDATGQ